MTQKSRFDGVFQAAKQQSPEELRGEETMKQASNEIMKRLNLLIPESLHSRIKLTSVQKKRTMTDVVSEALNQWLEANE